MKNEKSPVWEYRQILRGFSWTLSGNRITFQPADLTDKILNFGSPSPIDVQVNGPERYINYEFAQKLADKFRRIPGASNVVVHQTMRTPTMLVEANRRFALGMDMDQSDIGNNMLVTTAGSQQVDQKYWLDRMTGMSYRINVYTPQPQLTSLKDLMTVPITQAHPDSSGDNDVQLLGNLANISAIGTPGVITHGNIMPLFDIYVSNEGRDLGSVLADVEKVIHEMKAELPEARRSNPRQAERCETLGEMLFGLVAAIALVYLLIVINFQSWLDPLVIITALVGALAGIAWALFVTHTNVSVPALMGAIMTMGTATANSILLVAYARERLAVHGDALRAAAEAGTARIRPVLMTAAAMIIGMLPMSMGNAPLGRAVMGIDGATLFTLFSFRACMPSSITEGSCRKRLSNMKSFRGKGLYTAIILCPLYLVISSLRPARSCGVRTRSERAIPGSRHAAPVINDAITLPGIYKLV